MEAEFEKYIKAHTDLKDEVIYKVWSLAKCVTLNRNNLILEAGNVCQYKTFVCSGLLRTYSTDTKGNEHILQFSPELTWTLDVESYDKKLPSAFNIGAVEPTKVLLWKKPDFDSLLAEYQPLKIFSEQLISRNIYASRQRMLTVLSATPEEKYEDFTAKFPQLLSRLPLRMIASYLGISLKTLTRIRHAQLHR